MARSVIYDMAMELVESIKAEKPEYANSTVAFMFGRDKTYIGVTGLRLSDNFTIEEIPAEMNAFLNMRNGGEGIANGLVIIKLSDMSFVRPDRKVLMQMFQTNAINDQCLICLGEDESKCLSKLRFGDDAGQMMDGFDLPEQDFDEKIAEREQAKLVYKKPEPVKIAKDEAANVISGVEVKSDNPFYEKSATMAPPENTLAGPIEKKDDNAPEIIASLSGDMNGPDEYQQPEISAEELLKQAKKRKDIARSNFLFRKRHR